MSTWKIKEEEIERGTRKYRVITRREITDRYTLWTAANVTYTSNYRWEFVTVDSSLELRVLAQGLGTTLEETQAAADRWLLRHVLALAEAVLPEFNK